MLLLASRTQERQEPTPTARGIGSVVLTAAVPMVLILLQPDFGTFLVFVAVICVLLLVAGVRLRHLATLVVLGLVAIGLAWQLNLVEDYQAQRLTTFLEADRDPQGAE